MIFTSSKLLHANSHINFCLPAILYCNRCQSISYTISLNDVQQRMNMTEYISFRKITDRNFRAKFAYAVYGALLSNLSLIIVTLIYFDPRLLIVFTISFTYLVIDTIITLKGNMPINSEINTWSSEKYSDDWEEHRKN